MSFLGNGFSVFRCYLLRVQDVLDDIDSWPSRILNHIFIDEYDPPNSTATVAFFYGNRVPLEDALCFYTNCDDHDPLMTIIHFALLYRKRETSPVDEPTCNCTYYNVQLKKIQKIHFPQPESSDDENTFRYRCDRQQRTHQTYNRKDVLLGRVHCVYCSATSLIVFISSFQIMSNLWHIELMLGSLYSWPQDILRYLFLDTPTSYTTLRLAAFFFGNGIEQITAMDFFSRMLGSYARPYRLLQFALRGMEHVLTLDIWTNSMTWVGPV